VSRYFPIFVTAWRRAKLRLNRLVLPLNPMPTVFFTNPDVMIKPIVPVPDWPLSERGRARMRAMVAGSSRHRIHERRVDPIRRTGG
jgi:hypothetical protein